jgi:hypothetical protein
LTGLFDPALWGRSASSPAVLRRLYVIGPYPTKEFFIRIRESLNPQEVLLVVDDGYNFQEVESIRQVFKDRKCQVRYASCPSSGLVHAKLYLAEWESTIGTITTVRLAWGSPNASRNGFEVNAEAVSFATIDSAPKAALLLYFHKLWQKQSGRVDAVDSLIPGGVRLLLPGFRFTSSPGQESFESWIQSGRLCHKYEPDQTFARLSVTLRKPLPRDEIQSLFADADLRIDTDSRVFRFAYLDDVRGDGKKAPLWRARYFVETWYGFWTSDACYHAYRDYFTIQNEEQRKEILTRIKVSSAKEQEDWGDEFISRLRLVLDGLKKQGLRPGDYFYVKNRDVDVNHYSDSAVQQLRAHQKRAENGVFAERFTRGFVFPPLPRFRGAEAVEGGSFRDFVDSWCGNVLNGMAKRRHTSLVVQVLRKQLARLDVDDSVGSGEELRTLIEGHWRQIGTVLKAFHERSRPY